MKAKTQPTEWEKILAICVSDKRLTFKINKGLPKVNKNNLIQKWAKDLSRHFSN